MLQTAVCELKQFIAEHDGANAAGHAFTRRVDELIAVFYDDIGEITNVSTRALFDLFVIKVLYAGRGGSDAGVIDYLGRLLDSYLYTEELYPIERGGTRAPYYLSDLLAELRQPTHFQNVFEAYRRYADNSLFLTGVFPSSLRRRNGRRASLIDSSYYVSTGKRSYLMAAQQEMARFTQQRPLLEKLSAYFEVYVSALNEVSERYILGFDLGLIADKMLDSVNCYRSTGEERFLLNARRYAAILKVDGKAFPTLLEHRLPLPSSPAR